MLTGWLTFILVSTVPIDGDVSAQGILRALCDRPSVSLPPVETQLFTHLFLEAVETSLYDGHHPQPRALRKSSPKGSLGYVKAMPHSIQSTFFA